MHLHHFKSLPSNTDMIKTLKTNVSQLALAKALIFDTLLINMLNASQGDVSLGTILLGAVHL